MAAPLTMRTQNFVHGFDHCCISVGFCDGKVPSIGCVQTASTP